VAGLIVRDGKLLVCQRTRHQTMPLKWEFPGGKIELGEQPRSALRRELEEELGILATIGDEVKRIQHEYPNGGMVELRFFIVREYQRVIENRIFRDVRWAEPKDLPAYDFLEADLTLVQELAAGKLL
ncbi:MAG TPA: (deoxy)nucleoside triphosphate pyrophosphohydrolase, partial [Candidatus Sulfotelmatobacter sp.]|nr:(deoxy)nucleoside triphosphate pyrophosphohydrolase [Candidatus Sulfotelmatobacter sp.]